MSADSLDQAIELAESEAATYADDVMILGLSSDATLRHHPRAAISESDSSE
jgi:hypothetical protein